MTDKKLKLSSDWSTLQRGEKINIYKEDDLQAPHYPNAEVVSATEEKVMIKDSRVPNPRAIPVHRRGYEIERFF
ncbi:hypothetical protein PTW37_16385 (plasmid) [Arthrobacter agilis]|uniref:hypothetical protein n=1 Tax=Arthrobacter agilis TaxID=37921 RepID=UPI002366DD22|nr:hypothetical protein [Arthrobacter agilis]WDF35082.1 hypothetical protein PTW37_16385 [Arthrobacter agilis]